MPSNARALPFLLAAVALAACGLGGMDSLRLSPIPSQLVAQMDSRGMKPSDPILVRIHKRESELEIWKRDRTGRYARLRTYPICRWSGRLGPKRREDDRQAPEGFYTVTAHQMSTGSERYLSFDLGFPNPLEAALGYEGSGLTVHGACSSSGSYAMTDGGIAEIYAIAREALAGGQNSIQVQALPFRMTSQNLARYRDDPNTAFWRNLKVGVDIFDVARDPPKVDYCGGRYVFNVRPIDPSIPLDPRTVCPALQVDPALERFVATNGQAEERAVAAPNASNSVPPPTSYIDGGMHPTFRRMLVALGPEGFGRATSGSVDVSRPEAALADPYTMD